MADFTGCGSNLAYRQINTLKGTYWWEMAMLLAFVRDCIREARGLQGREDYVPYDLKRNVEISLKLVRMGNFYALPYQPG